MSLGDHIAPALDGVPSRKHRIEALEVFYGWLRREQHPLTAAEDPTHGALAVPQGLPSSGDTRK